MFKAVSGFALGYLSLWANRPVSCVREPISMDLGSMLSKMAYFLKLEAASIVLFRFRLKPMVVLPKDYLIFPN